MTKLAENLAVVNLRVKGTLQVLQGGFKHLQTYRLTFVHPSFGDTYIISEFEAFFSFMISNLQSVFVPTK